MRKISFKNRKAEAGKLVTGVLVGSVVGATVGWLTAPAGEQARRKLRGGMSARERARTAEGNIESHARELVQEVDSTIGSGETPAMGRPYTDIEG
jgi:gas vesicle protein